MRRLLLLSTAFLVSGCSTLPPTHDPEGCDRVSESVKQAGSDLVVDGDLYCATDDGDCELTPTRIIASRAFRPLGGVKIPVHILRKEAEDYGDELSRQDAISLCFPPQLWFPSEGHYYGRFYLRHETHGRYHMAFYPRTKD